MPSFTFKRFKKVLAGSRSHEKETKPMTACFCSEKEAQSVNTCCGQPVEGICCIKVLGSGCKACCAQYEYVMTAVAEMNLDIQVEYVTDMEKIMTYGVTSRPAIVINEKAAVAGKVLEPAAVKVLLESYRE